MEFSMGAAYSEYSFTAEQDLKYIYGIKNCPLQLQNIDLEWSIMLRLRKQGMTMPRSCH